MALAWIKTYAEDPPKPELFFLNDECLNEAPPIDESRLRVDWLPPDVGRAVKPCRAVYTHPGYKPAVAYTYVNELKLRQLEDVNALREYKLSVEERVKEELRKWWRKNWYSGRIET